MTIRAKKARKKLVEKPETPKPEPKEKSTSKLTENFLRVLEAGASASCPEKVEEILRLENDTGVNEGSPAHYCRYFYFLTASLKPSLCLDIGTHKGMSSACLAAGNPEGLVVTVDVKDGEYKKICELPNVRRFLHEVKMDLRAGIDILFIDAEHDGKQPLNQFNKWGPFLKNNSVVFFDDIHLNPAMDKFWENFNPAMGKKFELNIHSKAGFGVLLIGG